MLNSDLTDEEKTNLVLENLEKMEAEQEAAEAQKQKEK